MQLSQQLRESCMLQLSFHSTNGTQNKVLLSSRISTVFKVAYNCIIMVHLKNYRSEMSIDRIFEVIRRTLVEHRAKQIIFEYADDGRVKALLFSLEISGTLHGFQMPARVERVEKILYPRG